MPKEYTVVVISADGSETLTSIRPEKGYSMSRFEDAKRRLSPGQAVELRNLERAPYSDPLHPNTWCGKGEPVARQEYMPTYDGRGN